MKNIVQDWLNDAPIGWRDTIRPIVQFCVDNDVPIGQIKEKFGGLRIYLTEGNQEVENMIAAAEEACASICQDCGNPGTTRAGSWFQTLCDEHAALRQK